MSDESGLLVEEDEDWQPGIMLVRTFRAQGRPGKLVMNIGQGPNGNWIVLALETQADDLEGVLASHAHQLVNDKACSLKAAVVEAEEYAPAWARGIPGPECGCPEIEP